MSTEHDQVISGEVVLPDRVETPAELRSRIVGPMRLSKAEEWRAIGDASKAILSVSVPANPPQPISLPGDFVGAAKEILRFLWESLAYGTKEFVLPVLAELSTSVREQAPRNWREADFDIETVRQVVSVDGIPLAWVPRSEIVTEVMRLRDRDERVGILLDRRDDVMADCLAILDEIPSGKFDSAVAGARKAVAAWRDGHGEVAQGYTAIHTEALITNELHRAYKGAVARATVAWDELTLAELRRAIALAPIVVFYTPWFPGSGTPPLKEFSRHMTVHNPCPEQYNPANCIIAIMLLCSLLRDFYESSRENSAGHGTAVLA